MEILEYSKMMIIFVWLRRKGLSLFLVGAWFGIASIAIAASNDESTLEYQVKGVFLIKFSSFVEWPPATFVASDTPLVVGILGDDSFGTRLDQIVARQNVLGGRPIILTRIHSIEEARGVHILFIGQSEKERWKNIQSSWQNKGVLTVAEFIQPGIVINFVLENNKVRFDVSLDQAERAGLQLSSKLLSVARVVREK